MTSLVNVNTMIMFIVPGVPMLLGYLPQVSSDKTRTLPKLWDHEAGFLSLWYRHWPMIPP